LKPYLGKLVLSDIRPSNIQEFMIHLEGKGLSPATRGKIFRYLKSILRSAIALEIIEKDPTHALRAPRVEQEETQFLKPEEVSLLLDHSDRDMRALLAVACFAGLRQGEILGLRWGDIDFKRKTINPGFPISKWKDSFLVLLKYASEQ